MVCGTSEAIAAATEATVRAAAGVAIALGGGDGKAAPGWRTASSHSDGGGAEDAPDRGTTSGGGAGGAEWRVPAPFVGGVDIGANSARAGEAWQKRQAAHAQQNVAVSTDSERVRPAFLAFTPLVHAHALTTTGVPCRRGELVRRGRRGRGML